MVIAMVPLRHSRSRSAYRLPT